MTRRITSEAVVRTSSHNNVLNLGNVADAIDLCKRVMRPDACGHLFCSTLQFAQWDKMLPKARIAEDCDSEIGEGLRTKERRKQFSMPKIFLCTTPKAW